MSAWSRGLVGNRRKAIALDKIPIWRDKTEQNEEGYPMLLYSCDLDNKAFQDVEQQVLDPTDPLPPILLRHSR